MKHTFLRELTPFQTEIHAGEESTVIEAIGEVDMETAPRLQKAITAAMAAQPRVLIIDLTAVTFLGSAGLGALVDTNRTAGPIDVRIVATDYIATRTLRLVGLDKVLSVFPSVAEASG